jgi:hypothetical protein
MLTLASSCRKLKKRAAAVIEGITWHDVYHLWPLRNSSGTAGWLFHQYGQPWKLYHSPDREHGGECGQLIKKFTGPWGAGAQQLRPESGEVAQMLLEGSEKHREDEEAFKEKEKGSKKRGWW